MSVDRTTEIRISVGLDAQNNPIEITWTADEGGLDPDREVKAMMLNLWDKKENNSMRLELWSKDFLIEEMRSFVYQSLLALADTLDRATSDSDAAADLREFSHQLGEKLELFGPKK